MLAIRNFLDLYGESREGVLQSPIGREALAELKALRDMARVLVAPTVHDRALLGPAWALLQALADEAEVTP